MKDTGMLYGLKFAFMNKMMAKHKKEAFDYTSADLFEIPEGASALINNSWFFGGDNPDGSSFKMRLGTRNNGQTEVFLIWITADGRYFATVKQEYSIEECPITVRNIIPGRDWDVTFDGTVYKMAPGTQPVDVEPEPHHIKLQFRYTARLPIFHPMMDGDTSGMCQAFAGMKWNKNFFKGLAGDTGVGNVDKSIRQVHYEQTGRMAGTVETDGVSEAFEMPGIRDRAFGKRDWNYMDCHVWLVATTERGEVCNFSIVSYPHAKRLFCGYTDFDAERNSSLFDYKMISYDHCNGEGPETMVADLSFTNGKCYRMTAHRTHDLITPFDSGNFYFHEGVGDFTFVEIPELGAEPKEGARTIKARGSIELGWNKDRSRWGTYEKRPLK